jgi:signal transduction histidine kinase
MTLSIRLKLTLWYAGILIVAVGVYVICTNVIAERQFHRTPEEIAEQIGLQQPNGLGRWVDNDPQTLVFNRKAIEEIRQKDLETIRVASGGIFLVLMVVSIAGGYVIAGRMLKPLRKINEAARTITANNLHITVDEVNSNDELGELINNFNEMLTRLDTSFDLQKQFVENASHELKTPLTISQANIEAVLHDNNMSREELESTLRTAMESTSFMNRLIEDLLLLAMMQEHMTQTTVKMADITTAAVTQLETVAKQHNKTLTYSPAPDARAPERTGNTTLLQRAVMNCIENAIKYARTTVTVTVTPIDGRTQVTITDDGTGIPATHLPHVWERFYRVDSSRARKSGGTGLGLAITKSIVEKHGGKVSIASEEGKHTTVTILV